VSFPFSQLVNRRKKHNNFKQPQGMIQQYYYSVEFIMEQNLKGG
jgi:hypothetical protein